MLAPAGICYYIRSPGYHGAAMNVAVARAADGLPRRAFTVDDIHRMIEAGIVTEDERFELIEGDLVMMAAKHVAHERIKHFLNMALVRAAPEGMFVGIEATLQLAHNILVEPDITVHLKVGLQGAPEDLCAAAPGGRLVADRGRCLKSEI